MGSVNYSSEVKTETPVVEKPVVVEPVQTPVAEKKSLIEKIKDFFNHNDCCE